MWTLRPGQRSAPRNLNAMLREYHLEVDAEIRRLRAEAEENDAPTDGLVELGPYEDDEDLASVNVVFRAVPRDMHLELLNRLDDLGKADTPVARKVLVEDQVEREYITVAVAEVRGLTDDAGEPIVVAAAGDDPLSAEDLEVLHAAGILPPLFNATKKFNLLRGSKKKRFGLQPPTTTSPTESATDAPSTCAPSVAAKAEPSSPSGMEPSTRTTLVPGVTF